MPVSAFQPLPSGSVPQLAYHRPSTAAGNPTAPTSVTLTRDLSSLAGTFTLPADPCYMTLSYRLASLGPVLPSGPGAPIMDWKQLTAEEIAEGAFSIPDPVTVGSSSVSIPIGRYQLDMRADASNGALPEGDRGRWASWQAGGSRMWHQ